ncbi:MAG: hypothetical protein AB7P03_11615 [Kofleriaceae bacterium]
MRERAAIEHELEDVRFDLERTLATLKDVIRERTDVKAHAKRAVERVRVEAGVRLDRMETWVVSFTHRMVATAKRYPLATAAVLVGAGAVATAATVAIVKHRQ